MICLNSLTFLNSIGRETGFAPEEDHVQVGSIIIQNHTMFVLDDKIFNRLREFEIPGTEKNDYFCNPRKEGKAFDIYWIDALKALFPDQVVYDHLKSGTFSGYGHGKEEWKLLNPDGSLIYMETAITHCEGSGSRCSYEHGPWYEHGNFTGMTGIPAEAKLREVVQSFLNRRATYADLKKAVGWITE